MKRKGGAATLEQLVEQVYPSEDGYAEVRAHRAFARALPPPLLRRTLPSRVYRGVLHVNTESAAWAQELQLMAPRVLEAIKKADPDLPIRELRFRVGPLARDLDREGAPAPPPLEPVEITPTLAAAIASIRDDGVRDAVLGAVRARGERSAPSRGRGE